MKTDPLIYSVLGEHAFGKYYAAKSIEWDSFRSIVTDWELKTYLNR